MNYILNTKRNKANQISVDILLINGKTDTEIANMPFQKFVWKRG